MPTICPNCLRPVRAEARYCGYCGSNLNPAALDEASADLTILETNADSSQGKKPKAKTKAAPGVIRRRILIAIVILLCLVLLATFVIHYWPLINSYASSQLGLILSRKLNIIG